MTQPQPNGASTTETLARAYVPAEFEHAIYERWLAADVFAPGRRRLHRRPGAAAVRDHPAAAERHRLASTSATPSAPRSRT